MQLAAWQMPAANSASAAAAAPVALRLGALPDFVARARACCCSHVHTRPPLHPPMKNNLPLQIHDELLLEADGSLDVRWVAQASNRAPAPAARLSSLLCTLFVACLA